MSNCTKTTCSLFVVFFNTTPTTVPIAPLVSPSDTSMLVVSITRAPTLIFTNLARLPVLCGLSGKLKLAKFVCQSLVTSQATYVYSLSFIASKHILFQLAQCSFWA